MENTCSDCKRFVQHYTFCNGKIMRVYCGHCGYPRTKIRNFAFLIFNFALTKKQGKL